MDRFMITTNETYPWSIVTQIFRNSYPGHGDNCKKSAKR